MKSIYYKIWVDAIVFEKTKHGHMRNWKVYTLFPLSFLHGLNLFTILMWIFVSSKISLIIKINVFPGNMLDSFLSGFITIVFPFIIVNYLLIFKNDRYKDLIDKYEYKNGRLYFIYCISSLGLFIGPVIIGKWLL